MQNVATWIMYCSAVRLSLNCLSPVGLLWKCIENTMEIQDLKKFRSSKMKIQNKSHQNTRLDINQDHLRKQVQLTPFLSFQPLGRLASSFHSQLIVPWHCSSSSLTLSFYSQSHLFRISFVESFKVPQVFFCDADSKEQIILTR